MGDVARKALYLSHPRWVARCCAPRDGMAVPVMEWARHGAMVYAPPGTVLRLGPGGVLGWPHWHPLAAREMMRLAAGCAGVAWDVGGEVGMVIPPIPQARREALLAEALTYLLLVRYRAGRGDCGPAIPPQLAVARDELAAALAAPPPLPDLARYAGPRGWPQWRIYRRCDGWTMTATCDGEPLPQARVRVPPSWGAPQFPPPSYFAGKEAEDGGS